MLTVRRDPNETCIETAKYRLIIDSQDARRVRLRSSHSGVGMDLFVASSCNTTEGIDQVTDTGPPTITESGDRITVEYRGTSGIWDAKKYFFSCGQEHLEYYYTVNGKRAITDCHFFEGFSRSTASCHHDMMGEYVSRCTDDTPSIRRDASTPEFVTVFNPEPNHEMKQHFWYGEYSVILACSDSKFLGQGFHDGCWQFAPSPFCYVVSDRERKEWLTFGLAVRPKEYGFTAYEYIGGSSFGLNLAYEGHTRVDGTWESPHVVLLFADGEYDGLRRYVTWLEANRYVRFEDKMIPGWWRYPIVCGWGQQHYYLSRCWFSPSRPPSGHPSPVDYATQANYEAIVEVLRNNRLPFVSLVIDDKWQTFYGDPWPDPGKWADMRGFIDRLHDEGKRVLLWLKAWDCEGVPVEECVTTIEDKPVTVDPSNPSYESRLRKAVNLMLSPKAGCLNADGFKIDGIKAAPTGKALRSYGSIWGVELVRRLFEIIHDEAKKTKCDAMIMAHTANPYFSDVVDVLRLNDIHHACEHIVERMTHRAKVARIACPSWLIDTDNWPVPNRETWLKYMRVQPQLGIPSLYFATHLETSLEPIRPEDYAELREIWGEYVRGLAES